MNDWFLSNEVLIQSIAIYAVLGFSFQFALRTGVFSFASVGFFGAGAYVAGNLAENGLNGVLACVIVMVGSGLIAYPLSIPLVRLRGLYLGMVTFAFDMIMVTVANNGGDFTGGAVGLFGIPAGVGTGGMIVIAVVCALLLSQLERKNLGRAFSALRSDELLARSVGKDTVKLKRFVFSISAALGGLSGGMYIFAFGTMDPGEFGFPLIVTGLTIAVVGGVASWRGAVIGAVIVEWVPDWFDFLGRWSPLVYGVLVVVVATWAPQGILGFFQAGYRRARRHRPAPSGPPAAGPPVDTRPEAGLEHQVNQSTEPAGVNTSGPNT